MNTITRKILDKCYICGRSSRQFIEDFDLGSTVTSGAELPTFQPHTSKYYVETATGKRVLAVSMETGDDHYEGRYFFPGDVEYDGLKETLKVICKDTPVNVIRKEHYDSVAAEAHEEAEARVKAWEVYQQALPPRCKHCYSHGHLCNGVLCFFASEVTEIRLYHELCPVCNGMFEDFQTR